MRVSRNLAYMFVNSNTYLLSIILIKSVFQIMSIFPIYHFNMLVAHRCQLILTSIEGQWEFSIANFL